MSKKVLVPLANGFEELEAVAMVDVMRRGGLSVTIAGVDGLLLKGAHGISIQSDCDILDIKPDEFDMIVLPGGYAGTMTLCENQIVQSILKSFDTQGKNIGAICAAPLALDRAGVLKGSYTCYPGVSDSIKSSVFVEQSIVESENVMTSRGPGQAICFAIAIVAKLVDEPTAQRVKDGLLASYC